MLEVHQTLIIDLTFVLTHCFNSDKNAVEPMNIKKFVVVHSGGFHEDES